MQVHVETERDLGRALALEDERRRGRQIPPGCPRPQALLYSEHVRYVEQLRRYHELFGRARVLVLIYDDFRARNEATVRRVLRFLEVDELAPIEVVEANPTVAVRSLRLHRAVQAVQVGTRARLRSREGVGQDDHLAAAAPCGAACGQARRGLRRAAARPTRS